MRGSNAGRRAARCAAAALGALAVLAASGVAAQGAYPAKPARIVVPYPPGGVADTVTRLYARGLAEALGQPFIIENRPGGGTNIGAEIVSRAQPDGYTLFMASLASHGVNPTLFAKLGYDAVRDFAGVGQMVKTYLYLFVTPSLPAKTVPELVEYAKARPGRLSYASTGLGSPQHMAGELFKTRFGLDIVHVAYKGAAQALPDLVSGQVQLMFDATALPLSREGRVRVVALADTKRSSIEPDIPSFADQGVPGFAVNGFFGLVAPAKTPPAVLERLNAVMLRIAAQDETRRRVAEFGMEVMPMTRAELDAFIRAEVGKWRPVVKASGARAE